MPHVGVGLQVEDPVAALERVLEQRLVEHVALDEPRARPLEQLGDELAAAGAEVVDDHDLDALCAQPVRQRAADEPGAAGDAGAPHPLEREARGDGVATWNICTVSSEN